MTVLEERTVLKYKREVPAQVARPSEGVNSRATSGDNAKATGNQPLTLREFTLWSVLPGFVSNAFVALMVGGAVKLFG